MHETKGQKIVCLNIRSLYANFSLLEADFANSNIVAICLTETWLKPSLITGLVNIPGFRLVRLDRQGEKRGGGVAIYLNSELTFAHLDISFDISSYNIELLTIQILRKKQKALYISTVYLPPKANINTALAQLDTLADHLSNINKIGFCVVTSISIYLRMFPAPKRNR